MAIDCSDVTSNITYDCANPWGQDCTSHGIFKFGSLWKYTQNIQQACANDTRLFLPHGGIASPQNASLTQKACADVVGWKWTYCPTADIWTRLTTWKFPLFQLVASFPRPPLSFYVECFVIVHLLGDPIDTIYRLLAKMSSCQRFAEYWRVECKQLLENQSGVDEDRDWKALALLTDAYGEWGEDGQAMKVLQQGLHDNLPQHRKELASAVRRTGRALAADRSTKLLPIFVALAFFIGAIGIAIFRTASAAGARASSDTVFINVEAHSIAFSALYFWIIPAVFLGSIIGVSQTEAAIPRILRRFELDVERLDLRNEVKLPNQCLKDKEKRVFHGGIYSWRPRRCTPSDSYLTYQNVLPYLVMIIGTASGMFVSALVPPDGWNCRHNGEILISIAWLLSALADALLDHVWPLNENNQRRLLWTTGIKDLLFTIATMGGIIVTQVGVFNRCSCYTLWGKAGLALPEMPDIAETLFYRLHTAYPAITFTSICVELIIIPLSICIHYRDALRTFVQRDDRTSNAAWFWALRKRNQASRAKIRTPLSRNPFGLSKARRTGTLRVEEGAPGGSDEMQPLTHGPGDIATEVGSAAGLSVGDGQSEPIESSSPSRGADPLSGSRSNVPSG